MKTLPKLLIILGPTATGKSDLAVKIAKKYDGEIISADSRQVYMGLNIGTGKISRKEMSSIPHHMLDIVSPKKRFDVAQWQKRAKKIIEDIARRGKLPIICGGTGFYIQSIVDNIVLPDVPPNKKMREKLEQKSAPELVTILKKLDPRILKTIDKNNPSRLVRAIEIATALGSVPKITKGKKEYSILQIGLDVPDEVLKKRIYNRLMSRLKKGMVQEAKKLQAQELLWKRMDKLGLEYRYLSRFLQKKISRTETISKLNTEIWHYAKRQRQWFNRDKSIRWFEPKEMEKIKKEVAKFIKK